MSVIEGPWKAQAKPKAQPWRPPALSMLSGGLGAAFTVDDRSHIHPDLDGEFATQIEFAAALVRELAKRSKLLKRVHEEITFSNAAEIFEHRALMIRVEIGDHD